MFIEEGIFNVAIVIVLGVSLIAFTVWICHKIDLYIQKDHYEFAKLRAKETQKILSQNKKDNQN